MRCRQKWWRGRGKKSGGGRERWRCTAPSRQSAEREGRKKKSPDIERASTRLTPSARCRSYTWERCLSPALFFFPDFLASRVPSGRRSYGNGRQNAPRSNERVFSLSPFLPLNSVARREACAQRGQQRTATRRGSRAFFFLPSSFRRVEERKFGFFSLPPPLSLPPVTLRPARATPSARTRVPLATRSPRASLLHSFFPSCSCHVSQPRKSER